MENVRIHRDLVSGPNYYTTSLLKKLLAIENEEN